jgi:signal transduction histidine kinase
MKVWNNLRFRLVMLVLMAVIPALFFTAYSGFEQRRLAREQAVDDAFFAVRLAAAEQDTLVRETSRLLTLMALSPEVRSASDCAAYLQKLQPAALISAQSLDDVRIWYLVTDRQGQVICASGDDAPVIDLASRSSFQRALEGQRLVIGRPFYNDEPGLTLLPVVLPVADDAGLVGPVVVALLDLTSVMRPVLVAGLPPDSALLLVDERGTVLGRYPGGETWVGESLPDAPIISTILASRAEGSSEVQGVDQVLRLYAFAPLALSDDYQSFLAAGVPSAAAFEGANRLMWQSMLGVGLAGLLAFMAAWFGGDVLFLRVVSLTAERDAAEQKLRQANAVLETRVAERTAELNKSLKLLERSNLELQDFAYITSHDLQEPLRKIQAFGGRLSDRYADQLNDEGRMFVERMNASAARMQRMINDLLDYSRLTSRAHQFERVALNEVVREVISDLEVRINETGGKVEVADLPEVMADPLQMRQLMQNLIANALKFHRPGVPPVVKVGANGSGCGAAEAGRVVLHVEDNGIGFDEKYVNRIFVPFQRLHSKDTYEGSGIGLAVCRKIADRHGGEIQARSTPGQGSCFIITLPTHDQQERDI